jgi:hypothetical protein
MIELVSKEGATVSGTLIQETDTLFVLQGLPMSGIEYFVCEKPFWVRKE